MSTVLLAHAHPAVRLWVRGALARVRGIEFVTEAHAGEEALGLLAQLRWDAALIACSLPGTPGGVALVERVREAGLPVHTLALGTDEDDGLLCRLWRAGALGCIPEDTEPGPIAQAVQEALRGKRLWTPEQAMRIQDWWEEVGSRLERLSERERQVLALLAEGLSNRQIAERFSLSVNTVRTHVQNVLGKLGVSSRMEAALFLMK